MSLEQGLSVGDRLQISDRLLREATFEKGDPEQIARGWQMVAESSLRAWDALRAYPGTTGKPGLAPHVEHLVEEVERAARWGRQDDVMGPTRHGAADARLGDVAEMLDDVATLVGRWTGEVAGPDRDLVAHAVGHQVAVAAHVASSSAWTTQLEWLPEQQTSPYRQSAYQQMVEVLAPVQQAGADVMHRLAAPLPASPVPLVEQDLPEMLQTWHSAAAAALDEPTPSLSTLKLIGDVAEDLHWQTATMVAAGREAGVLEPGTAAEVGRSLTAAGRTWGQATANWSSLHDTEATPPPADLRRATNTLRHALNGITVADGRGLPPSEVAGRVEVGMVLEALTTAHRQAPTLTDRFQAGLQRTLDADRLLRQPDRTRSMEPEELEGMVRYRGSFYAAATSADLEGALGSDLPVRTKTSASLLDTAVAGQDASRRARAGQPDQVNLRKSVDTRIRTDQRRQAKALRDRAAALASPRRPSRTARDDDRSRTPDRRPPQIR